MIKAVLFDAGGVLHTAVGSQSDDLRQELGLTDEQIGKFYAYYLPKIGVGVIDEVTLWKEMRAEFGIRVVSVEEHLLTRAFEGSLQKIPGMYDLVDKLKLKGLTVALLTNVSPQFAEILAREGHYAPFQVKILSFEVGSWKPDVEIYKTALKKVAVRPDEAVFIDDQQENIDAAISLGIHGILFRDVAQLKSELDQLL